MDAMQGLEVASSLSIQLAIAVLATFALQRWLGDARAGCRLWTICFIGIIGLIAAGVSLPHRRLFDFPIAGGPETMLSIFNWQTALATTLLAIWAVGVVFLALWRLWLCGQLSRFLRHQCVELDVETWRTRFNLDFAPQTRMLASDKIHGPFCWQFHQPTIVLPQSLLDEDEMTLRHVLLHEVSHLRTRHPMQHFLQGVCSTVFWFHPAMWAAAGRADLTREFLCDEVAATASGKISAYLRTLAKVAECCGNRSRSDVPRGTLAFGNKKSALLRRSDRLVELARPTRPVDRIRVVVASAGLALVLVLAQQVWLPTNALASSRSKWSPWPTWTANICHDTLGVSVRDYESYEAGSQIHDWMIESKK